MEHKIIIFLIVRASEASEYSYYSRKTIINIAMQMIFLKLVNTGKLEEKNELM